MKTTLILIFGSLLFENILLAQSACFSSANDNVFAGPTNGQVIEKGDFDNDGKLDVVIANFTVGSNKMNFIKGDGDGTFQPPVLFEGGTRPVALKAADFNLDGNLDLAVANFNPANLSILFGNGNGTFQAPVLYTPNSGPNDIDLGDFNGDGSLDIVVSTNNGFNIFLGSPATPGTFTGGSQFNMANGTRGIVAADLNNDGYKDVATSNMTAGNVSVRFGTGTGSFGAMNNFTTGAGCYAVTAADFDNDGDQDLATSNETADNMSVLINDGAGNFATAVNYAAGDGPDGIINQDLNLDGKKDIILVNSLQNSLSVYLGNGNGTFQTHQQSSAIGTPKDLVAGAFNTDAFPDIVVSTAVGQVMPVFIGNGTATYTSGITIPAGTNPKALHYADFNGDGKQDLVVANSGDNNFSYAPGLGNGYFGSATNYTTGTLPVSVYSADLNHDGFSDVVTANTTSNSVSVFLGNGTGVFSTASSFACNSSPNFVRIADLNNDTHPDIVVINSGNQFSVLNGTGTGTFSAPTAYATGNTPVALVIKTLNGDAYNDVVVVNNGSNNIGVFLNSGAGTFGTATNYAVGNTPSGIDAGDLDNDSDMDLVVSNAGGNNISRLLNNGSGVFGTATNYTSGDATAKGVVINDYNNDGKQDAMVIFNVAAGTTGYASVFMGNGSGTLTFYKRFSTGIGPVGIVSTDFNNDTRKDIAVVNELSRTVTILLNTTAQISANGPTSFCNGNNVVLQGLTAPAYSWSNGQTTQSITVGTTGTYTLTTSEGISNWCTSTSAPITVDVTAGPTAPTITASGPTTFCAGQNVVLTSSQSTGNNWSTGETSQSITVSTPGSYTVNYVSGGCTSQTSTPTVVSVYQAPVITASGPTTFCSGQSVVLTSSAASGNTWSNSANTQSITVTSSGTYTVTSTEGGCAAQTSNPITITVNPAPPTPTISASGSTTICSGQNVVLTSSSSTNNTWSTGETTQSITVNSSGTYTVSVSSASCPSVSSTPTVVTVNPTPAAPTITAGGPTTFCSGNSVVLTSSSSSGNNWSNGGTTPSITVTSSGTYSATVTTNGCTSSASAPITVTVNPTPSVPTISTSGSTTLCTGQTVTLTSSASTGNTWSNGALTPSITVSSSGTFSVTATAGGCTSAASVPVTVTVNTIPPAPTITSSGPTTFCTGGNVALTSSASTGNTWSNGGNTPSILVNSSGTYSVTTTVNGCTSPSSGAVTVTVLPNPSPPNVTANGPTSFCVGGSVVLTSSVSSGIQWSTGASTTSITVSSPGTYTVTYTDGNGCSATSSPIVVDVGTTPPTPTISPNGNAVICEGTSIVLTSSASSGNTWSNGETTTSITVTQAGSYSVFATISGCSSAASSPTTVTVNPAPPQPTVSPAGPLTICQGDTVVLTSSSGLATDIWSTSEVGSSIVVSSEGHFNVTTTNAYNCSSFSEMVYVYVNPLPEVTLGNMDILCVYNTPVLLENGTPAGGTYSGNGVNAGMFDPSIAGTGLTMITYTYEDTNGCSNSAQNGIIVDDCLGINETVAGSFQVYPNPSGGLFNIVSDQLPIAAIRVFDSAGKLVKECSADQVQTLQLDIHSLASGIYNAEILSGAYIEHVQLVINK